jgi:hypothetical protein
MGSGKFKKVCFLRPWQTSIYQEGLLFVLGERILVSSGSG